MASKKKYREKYATKSKSTEFFTGQSPPSTAFRHKPVAAFHKTHYNFFAELESLSPLSTHPENDNHLSPPEF
jgi:hypothetical protein